MKQQADFKVESRRLLGGGYALLKLRGPEGLTGEARPGMFVNVAVDVPGRLLRRPISVCNVDDDGLLWLLVRDAGPATHKLVADTPKGSTLNLLAFLGRGFTLNPLPRRPLLVGGGVGVAPLLFAARKLAKAGAKPTVILAAKTKADLLLRRQFEKYANVEVATDDGSDGHHGFAHTHPAFDAILPYDACYICGPKPMMRACAERVRRACEGPVEVSLENTMACGLGACLCCVEPVKGEGNVTVCTHGPVFNVNELEEWT